MCELYGMLGSLFGCTSIWTMVVIALDRYNVIVKGLSAKPLTTGGALFRILLVWLFSVGWTIAPMFGWNRYSQSRLKAGSTENRNNFLDAPRPICASCSNTKRAGVHVCMLWFLGMYQKAT